MDPISLIAGVGLQQAQSTANREQQAADNMRLWQIQAQYNSPVEQVKRLKEANLSPHLAYGHGNIVNSQNQAPQPADYAAANQAGQAGIENMLTFIMAKKAETETERTKAEADKLRAETNNLGIEGKILAIENEFRDKTLTMDIEAKNLGNSLLKENIKKTSLESETEVQDRLLKIAQTSNIAQLTDHTGKLFPTTFQQAVENVLKTRAERLYTDAMRSKVPYEKTQLLAQAKELWKRAENTQYDTELKKFSYELSKSGLTIHDSVTLRLLEQAGVSNDGLLSANIGEGLLSGLGGITTGALARYFGRKGGTLDKLNKVPSINKVLTK